MATEIHFDFTVGLTDLRVTIRDWNGQIWDANVSLAFETPVSGSWADYIITPTEIASTGIYRVNFPTTIESGEYLLTLYRGTAVGSPIVGNMTINWCQEMGAREGFLAAIYRRFYKRATMTSTTLTIFDDDGSTILTTQTVSDSGGTQTQGTA